MESLASGAVLPVGRAGRQLARRLVDAGLAHPRPGPAATLPGPEDVTVVIPVRDRPLGLADTLTHLGPRLHTVVVDDASCHPAGTVDAVAASELPDVQLLSRPVQGGPAAARNTGWHVAPTPLVAFVDANCRPAPGWLPPLTAHFADPLVGAVAPRIVTASTIATPRWLVSYERHKSPLDLGPTEAAVRPRSRVPYVPSATLVVRRDALTAIGGFDEAMRVGEDVDLIWRLVDAGWRIRYHPASTVSHPVRPTVRAWIRQRFDYGRSAAALAVRHPGAVTALDVSATSAWAWVVGALGYPRRRSALAASVAVATVTNLWSAVPRLQRTSMPATEWARLATTGHLLTGKGIAVALRRSWWPAVLPLLWWRRWRPTVLVVAVVPAIIEWCQQRPSLDPLRWTVLCLADDVAYGAGVWAGALEAHSAAAIRPRWRR